MQQKGERRRKMTAVEAKCNVKTESRFYQVLQKICSRLRDGCVLHSWKQTVVEDKWLAHRRTLKHLVITEKKIPEKKSQWTSQGPRVQFLAPPTFYEDPSNMLSHLHMSMGVTKKKSQKRNPSGEVKVRGYSSSPRPLFIRPYLRIINHKGKDNTQQMRPKISGC